MNLVHVTWNKGCHDDVSDNNANFRSNKQTLKAIKSHLKSRMINIILHSLSFHIKFIKHPLCNTTYCGGHVNLPVCQNFLQRIDYLHTLPAPAKLTLPSPCCNRTSVAFCSVTMSSVVVIDAKVHIGILNSQLLSTPHRQSLCKM